MKFMIERAVPQDAAALLDYLKDIGGETDNLTFGAEGLPFTVEQEETFLEELLDASHSAMFVAKVEGRIVGDVSVMGTDRARTKHRADIGISVRREMWGNGIGRALMQTIIDFAKHADIEILHLQVRSDNARAIRLYESCGFVKIGQYKGLLKIDGELIDCDLMNLYL